MAIITISRGAHSKGKEIAQKVAEKLGYECVSRDILLEASEHFHIPEVKLVRALHNAPSIWDRFTLGKERFIAFIEEAFLEHVRKDNIVYHGLAGHFFLKGVSHNLKVRIIADKKDRIRLEMERENISEDEAWHTIEKDDYERHRWSMSLYGTDTTEPSLYDLIIHLHKITVDEAVDIICQTAQLPKFRTTTESQNVLDDLVLAAKVRVAIINKWPNVKVKAMNGEIFVNAEATPEQSNWAQKKIVELVKTVPGVKEVRVSVSLLPIGERF